MLLKSVPASATCAVVSLLVSVIHADNIVYEPAVDPRIGYNIWDPTPHTENLQRLVNEVNAMHAGGMNEVSFIPFAYTDMTTGHIQQFYNGQVFGSMTDSELDAGIRRAKELGMKVTITPIIQQRDRGDGRDQIDFTPQTNNGVNFWNDYKTNFVRWAQVAQNAGADKFNIGSEMVGLDNNIANKQSWTDVINAVDAAFTGRIGYTTQHWTFGEANIKEMIWNNPKIDYVSFSAYPTYQPGVGKNGLASDTQAAGSNSDSQAFVNTVRDNFIRYLNTEIFPLISDVNKPLIIGEFGLTPFDGASTIPYKWWYSVDPNDPNFIAYDPLEQKNAWEGIIRALDGKGAQIEAIHAWIWGWQGGFGGEQFYMRPGATDITYPYANFDESQAAMASNFLTQFATSLPEPASMSLIFLSGLFCLKRQKTN